MPANRPRLSGDFPVLDDTPNTATAIENAFLDGGGVPVSTSISTDTGHDDKVPSVKAVEDVFATISDAKSVKVYRALLTQAGTAAPTAHVLENTLGGTLVWSRASAGLYLGTLAGVFTANKTFAILSGVLIPGVGVVGRVDDDTVALATNSSGNVDDLLTNASVEIRVYV